MMPLFDSYAGGSKALEIERKTDSRLNPILRSLDDLPTHVFLVNAGIDNLLHEELTFIDRLNREKAAKGNDQRVFKSMVFEKGFHGWLDRMFAVEQNMPRMLLTYHRSPF